MISAEIFDVAMSGRTIVRDLSLAIRQGEVVGLLGPNGAGKSTLIRVLAGHLPYRGRVEIAGHDLRGLAHDARARLVAYLPQQREIAWPLSVEHAVALGRMPWSRRNGGAEGRSRTICREAMGLMYCDCPAASRLAYWWPAPSPRIRRCSWPTNRRQGWIRRIRYR